MLALTQSRVTSEIKACLTLAIPLASAQLAQSATAFVDTVMMGWLGSQTIAAGGLAAITFNTLFIIGISIVSAVSPMAAEAFGAGKRQAVGQSVSHGLWLALFLSLPITLVLWNGGLLLQGLGQEPENIALAEVYLRAIAWGYLPGLGFAVLRSYISALSLTRPIMAVIVVSTLLNIVGNYVLMFGKFGFPTMGLAGIGLSSALSHWFTFLALAVYALVQPRLRVYQILPALSRFDFTVFRELLKIGLPIGILAGVEVGLFTVTSLLMGQISTATLAAHQIALQTASLTFTVPLGVSIATTVRVGQCIGQNNFKAAKLAGYVGIGIGSLFMSMMGLLMWTMPEPIVSLYLDIHDPVNKEVVDLAKTLLGVAAVFQLVDGVQVTANGALRGLKDTFIPMMIGIFAYWCLGLSSGYMLGFQWGFGGVGLWWGLAIGLAVAASVLTWRFSTAQSRRSIITQQPKPLS